MINKPFDEIVAADILQLVEGQVRERRTLDYKQELPSNSDADKREFLADVSSFANMSGGDLIFGVREEDGVATAAPGIACINADDEILRLESIVRNGLAPRLIGFRTKAVEGLADGLALIMRIPQSWAAPHMVTFSNSSRFHTRNSAGKHQMDVTELRAAFAMSDSLPNRVRDFRADRLVMIREGRTPVAMNSVPKMVLHIVPYSAFSTRFRIDPKALHAHHRNFLPLHGGGTDHRYNVDGYLVWNAPRQGDDGCIGYCQAFHSDGIEAVDGVHLMSRRGGNIIASIAYERDIISRMDSYLSAMRGMDVPLPLTVMLSLLGVRDYYMASGARREMFAPVPIDRDDLLLPDVLIDDYECNIERTLRPIFDAVWNACGYAGSLNYDEDGNWREER